MNEPIERWFAEISRAAKIVESRSQVASKTAACLYRERVSNRPYVRPDSALCKLQYFITETDRRVWWAAYQHAVTEPYYTVGLETASVSCLCTCGADCRWQL